MRPPPRLQPVKNRSNLLMLDLQSIRPGKRERLYFKADDPGLGAKYERTIEQYLARGRRWDPDAVLAPLLPACCTTVGELAAAYLDHAQHWYRKHGAQTEGYGETRRVIQFLLEDEATFDLPAGEFGPRRLHEFMVRLASRRRDDGRSELARSTINQYVSRLRMMFRWGAGLELIPADQLPGMDAVRGIPKGRSPAPGVAPCREREQVTPPTIKQILACVRQCEPAIAAMLLVQARTAMRPMEIRGIALDRLFPTASADVLVYHAPLKLEHLEGSSRRVLIGPKAMRMLAPWIDSAQRDGRCILFSPAANEAARNRARSAGRECYKGNAYRPEERRAGSRRRPPGDRYTKDSYRRAITRACERAGVEPFSPGQLRHLGSSRIANATDIHLAKSMLGHTDIRTTQRYTHASLTREIDYAQRFG